MNTHDDISIAVIGKVDAGKSALVNALVGRRVCRVSARAGETREIARVMFKHPRWTQGLPVVLVDTPGLMEAGGRSRADAAIAAVQKSDLVLIVADGDLTETEYQCILAF
ncbi:MAG TPA: 50S ribosome-binding GTPase, partial [bacterium]|nr:50S ribosome-binding GTPase [bacterium]